MNHIPTKAEILHWIADNPTLDRQARHRQGLRHQGRGAIDLKRILKELEAEGHLEKRKKTYRDPDRLPPVCVLQVTGADAPTATCSPARWNGTARGRSRAR